MNIGTVGRTSRLAQGGSWTYYSAIILLLVTITARLCLIRALYAFSVVFVAIGIAYILFASFMCLLPGLQTVHILQN